MIWISTHTPLAGRDQHTETGTADHSRFLLTRPSRGVTIYRFSTSNITQISTHTPLAGRDYILDLCISVGLISTHTPLAGRDKDGYGTIQHGLNFYSHAPRGA